MLSSKDIVSKVSLTKDLIADQTYDYVIEKWNPSNTAFDIAEGLGTADTGSTIVLITSGGYDDQRIIADMKFVAPTTAGSEQIGVMLRTVAIDEDATYYWARVHDGSAKITRYLDGTLSTLTQSAFPLAQDQVVTIDFSVVGNQLSATFTADGGTPSEVVLSTVDSTIPTGGIAGFRSSSSSVYCRNFTVEQV